jgi:hypothetical protein
MYNTVGNNMNLDEMTKHSKEQNDSIQSITGLSSIANMTKHLQGIDKIKNNFSVFNGIASLTENFAKQMKPFSHNLASIAGSSVELYSEMQKLPNLSAINGITNLTKQLAQQTKSHNQLSAVSGNITELFTAMEKLPKNNFAFSGLTSSLAQITVDNALLSNKISKIASSQLILSNNISEISRLFNNSHLNQFNGIEIALQGISNSYLKDIFKTKKWENFEIVEEVNEAISLQAEDLINNDSQITLEDLNAFKVSVIIELKELLSKSKSEKATLFILNLITVIGFIITLYTTFKPNTEITNEEVLNETKKEIEKISKELSEKIKFELSKLNKSRISTTNVNLRYSTKKKSKIIGIVTTGQKVSVIEIRHKYLLISYLDKVTGEPKSGFVMKKYFKVEK